MTTTTNTRRGISVKLPLTYDSLDGPYASTKNLIDTVKQNFKNLVLTIPGERIMNPNFGVGIHNLLFENYTPQIEEDFLERLSTQTNRYLPFVEIIDVETDFNEAKHIWNVRVHYFVRPLGVSDSLELNLADNERI